MSKIEQTFYLVFIILTNYLINRTIKYQTIENPEASINILRHICYKIFIIMLFAFEKRLFVGVTVKCTNSLYF